MKKKNSTKFKIGAKKFSFLCTFSDSDNFFALFIDIKTCFCSSAQTGMLHHIRMLAGGKCEAQANNHQLCVECPLSLNINFSPVNKNDSDGLVFHFLSCIQFFIVAHVRTSLQTTEIRVSRSFNIYRQVF